MTLLMHIAFILLFVNDHLSLTPCAAMSEEEKKTLQSTVKEMFLHGYSNYKNHAYPADELMPLSCKGRYRHLEDSRGDVDDALGNFSLTMIDALDSLFILNELDEFEQAVQMVVRGVAFDSDFDVSVFETIIRVVGGLLGAHIAAIEVQKLNPSRMIWYSNQLLRMAVDIADRLLPAFNTSTGIPYPRINLRYGYARVAQPEEFTCTACGGTMILEYAALSRLTGNPIYEEKAARAMAALWKQRNRQSNLMGRVIHVHSGDWVRRESGIGAGIDSYYEYLLKAYALLGEPVYLHRFHTHYEAIKRYVGGPQSASHPFLFMDVLMHRPSERARGFMDALLAFWPGLQVLTGDVKSAVALHEFLFQVYKRNKLLPEAFTPDFRVHWGEHLIRPELVESTYLLYRATNDPYYLDVGAQIVEDIRTYSQVPCGFAAIEDVRTMKHSDRFDSFVLAETFKYLYLLFSEPADIPVRLSEYVFTTEAHLLPLSLSKLGQTGSRGSMLTNLSSADNVLFSTAGDPHGDRDHVMENRLRFEGKCPAVAIEHMFSSTSSFQCNEVVNSTLTKPHISDLECSIWDGPNVYRTKLLWLSWINQSDRSIHPSRLCFSSDSANSNTWRVIESIREPLRILAKRLAEPSKTNLNSAQLEALQQSMASFVPLRAADFRPNNPEHMSLVKRMGIDLSVDNDGQISVRHDQKAAESSHLAVAGLLFIQELVLLSQSRLTEIPAAPITPRHVVLLDTPSFGRIRLKACPAHFGLFPGEDQTSSRTNLNDPNEPNMTKVSQNWQPVMASVRVASPLDGCSEIKPIGAAYPSTLLDWTTRNEHPDDPNEGSLADSDLLSIGSQGPLRGSIAIVRRGGCLFIQKAKMLAKAGAVAGIVLDTDDESSADKVGLFTMSGEDDEANNHVPIPFVLLYGSERKRLLRQMRNHWLQFDSPTTVMVTKDYDPIDSFSSSLRLFLGKQPLEMDQEYSRIQSEVRAILPHNHAPIHYLPSTTSGGLSVRQLSDSGISCDQQNSDSCRAPQTYATEPVWAITLFMNSDEMADYFITTGHESQGYPNRIESWIKALNHTLSSNEIGPQCQGIILATVELALHNATQRVQSRATVPLATLAEPIHLFIQSCFERLPEFRSDSSVVESEVHRSSFVTLFLSLSPINMSSIDSE